jgi:hypothetical protein
MWVVPGPLREIRGDAARRHHLHRPKVEVLTKRPDSDLSHCDISLQGCQVKGTIRPLEIRHIVMTRKQKDSHSPTDGGLLRQSRRANFSSSFVLFHKWCRVLNGLSRAPGARGLSRGLLYGLRRHCVPHHVLPLVITCGGSSARNFGALGRHSIDTSLQYHVLTKARMSSEYTRRQLDSNIDSRIPGPSTEQTIVHVLYSNFTFPLASRCSSISEIGSTSRSRVFVEKRPTNNEIRGFLHIPSHSNRSAGTNEHASLSWPRPAPTAS